MAKAYYYVGTSGPFIIDDTHPLYTNPKQLARLEQVDVKLDKSEVYDGLDSNSAAKALSAKQGLILATMIAARLEPIIEYQVGTATPTGKVFTIRKYDDGTFDWEELV